MKYKKFETKELTRIYHLGVYNIRLSNGQIFLPPKGYQLDFADAVEGVYSYKSDAGFWRTWVWGGQTNSEFVSNSYFAKLDKIKLEKI